MNQDQLLLEKAYQSILENKDVTSSPDFQQWFSGSKVVDANGNPLKVYHGTQNGRFTAFRLPEIRDEHDPFAVGGYFYNDAKKTGNYLGIWFSESLETAELFAGITSVPDRKVFSAYLQIKRPLIFDTYLELERVLEQHESTLDYRSTLQSKYDGVIIAKATTDTGILRKDFVVFNPSQIYLL
jgi:hypothetical protein